MTHRLGRWRRHLWGHLTLNNYLKTIKVKGECFCYEKYIRIFKPAEDSVVEKAVDPWERGVS